MKPSFLPDPELLKSIDFKHPATWVATWFGCGFLRPAPGTWGTLGAIPPGLILLIFGGPVVLAIVAVGVFLMGLWAAREFEKMTGHHDNSMIVIDEVAGLWIVLLVCALEPFSILLAFALFRLFDVWKPWPVGWLDKNLPDAWGVMVDDIAAGVLAALCLWGIQTYAFTG